MKSISFFKNKPTRPIITSPLQFEIVYINIPFAILLNKEWHSRLPIFKSPYITKKHISFGARYKSCWYASAIWTPPISRLFNNRGFLELRRMAIAPDAPKNTASRMLSIMCKNIKARFPDIWKLISYQDTDVHLGTIYKASGWILAAKSHKSNWHKGQWSKGRKIRSSDYQAPGVKIRWERDIRKEPKKNKIRRKILLKRRISNL